MNILVYAHMIIMFFTACVKYYKCKQYVIL